MICFSSIGIWINPVKGFVSVPDKVKKYNFEEEEKEKNKYDQKIGMKSAGEVNTRGNDF